MFSWQLRWSNFRQKPRQTDGSREKLWQVSGLCSSVLGLATPDKRHVILSRFTQPEKELTMLLDALHPQLPSQPPPRITAKGELAE